jgi:hypothetical protein
MKVCIVVLMSLISPILFAQQPDHKSLGHAIKDFDRALVSRDTITLKYLLEDQVSYGHSNGWIQTKKDVTADLYNGKIKYRDIKQADQEIVIEDKAASVRFTTTTDVEMGGKAMTFKLKVLQMWIWENAHWVLLARQSVKI